MAELTFHGAKIRAANHSPRYQNLLTLEVREGTGKPLELNLYGLSEGTVNALLVIFGDAETTVHMRKPEQAA